MTIINRALHKAFERRAESEPAREKKRPGSASVSGWASKLREPIKPFDRPTLERPVPEPPIVHVPVELVSVAQVPVDQVPAEQVAVDDTPAAVEEKWSWPPIVQRLLTCPAAPEICRLAAHLRDLATGNELRCAAFSGPGRSAGRTSLVLTLASVLIADKKTRVAIVDADFNHPQVAQSISLIPSKGLEEAIDGPEVDLGAVTTLIAGRLDIVPLLKPIAADAIDRRRLGTMQTFLRTLRREYDVVLIDAGPWETGHPPLVLECRGVDAVVCVCRAQSTDGEPPGEKNFQQPGVEWLGVVETFVKAPPLDSRHN